MAFEEFGQLSKRRRVETAEQVKKRIVIGVVAFILVFLFVGGGILAYIDYYTNKNKESDHGYTRPGQESSSNSERIVSEVCGPADYKVKCEDTVRKVIKSGTLEPRALVVATVSAASMEFLKASEEIARTFKFDKEEDKAAYDNCKILFGYCIEELQVCLKKSHQYNSMLVDDLRTWLSASVSYQETCVNGFSDGSSEMKLKMREVLNATKGYLSNSLAFVTKLPELIPTLSSSKGVSTGAAQRHLRHFPNSEDHDMSATPPWVGREDIRNLMTIKLNPNVTVAKDGSGDFTTINEALAALPEKMQERIFIYIKEGTYNEYVIVNKKMANVTMYGDGSQKTIVTGNKSFAVKVPTFQTATFAAVGEGFIAMNMGFKNTAGPGRHQAVALRVQADKSIFLNCSMEAYQDTLYAQTHRQFYKACLISGTIDFIFGDAAAIFQDCIIRVRKPKHNQNNVITAQGRACRYENTGIVLQGCRIVPEKDFEQDRHKFKTYIGRPSNEFSRTVVMESTMGDLIDKQGWLKRVEDKAAASSHRLKTLYYAEYRNKGPGAEVKGRVDWPGYKRSLTRKEALGFTVASFFKGSWIKKAGVPVQLGLYDY